MARKPEGPDMERGGEAHAMAIGCLECGCSMEPAEMTYELRESLEQPVFEDGGVFVAEPHVWECPECEKAVVFWMAPPPTPAEARQP